MNGEIPIGGTFDEANYRRKAEEAFKYFEQLDREHNKGPAEKQNELEQKKLVMMREMLRLSEQTIKIAENENKLFEKKLSMIRTELGLTGGDGSFGGGGGGWSSGGGGSRGGFFGGGARRGFLTAGNVVATAGQAFQNAAFQGYSTSSVLHGVGDVLGAFGPVGQLLGVPAHLIGNEFTKIEDRRELRARLFRSAGERARQTFLTTEGGSYGFGQQAMETLGLTVQDRSRLIEGIERNGVDSAQAFPMAAILEGKFGLGSAATGQLGAMRRGGVGDADNIKTLGDSMGIALATGLERGRFGEVMSNVARAAQASATGFMSSGGIIGQQMLIGSLGGPGQNAFQGATPAAAAMEGMLDTLSKGGGGGLAEVQGMQELAKQFPGASYMELQARLAMGTKGGGLSADQVAMMIANDPMVRSVWASNPPGFDGPGGGAKLAAAQMAARIRGMPPEDGLRIAKLVEGILVHGAAGRPTFGDRITKGLRAGEFALPSDYGRLKQIVGSQYTSEGGMGTVEGGPVVQDTYEQGGSPMLPGAREPVGESLAPVNPGRGEMAKTAPHAEDATANIPMAWLNPGPGSPVVWFGDPAFISNVRPQDNGYWACTIHVRGLDGGIKWRGEIMDLVAPPNEGDLWYGMTIGVKKSAGARGRGTSSAKHSALRRSGSGVPTTATASAASPAGGSSSSDHAMAVSGGGAHTLYVVVSDTRVQTHIARGANKAAGILFGWG